MNLEQTSETLTRDGVTLTIIAVALGEREWELSIENARRVRTVWSEFFPSAKAALAAGRSAIRREGVAGFDDIEGFDYLDDLGALSMTWLAPGRSGPGKCNGNSNGD